jgi:hypothetical protein
MGCQGQEQIKETTLAQSISRYSCSYYIFRDIRRRIPSSYLQTRMFALQRQFDNAHNELLPLCADILSSRLTLTISDRSTLRKQCDRLSKRESPTGITTMSEKLDSLEMDNIQDQRRSSMVHRATKPRSIVEPQTTLAECPVAVELKKQIGMTRNVVVLSMAWS